MMESFALYMFKSALWLSGFALIYGLFLRNERFFILKRYYLLAGLLTSIIFPFISVNYTIEIPAPSFHVPLEYAEIPVLEPVPVNQINYMHLLLLVYCSGVIFLIFNMITQLSPIYRIIKKSDVERKASAKLIFTDKFASPFSFFNYIFLKPSLKGKEREMIMNHELVHVAQKHWIDLLFSGLVRLMQWFNPVAWVYATFIRQNNEYLADNMALKQASDPAIYKATLLNQLFGSPVISLSNYFSYSLNKKRFEMMKKTIRSPYRKIRVLFILPVFALLLHAFAEETYVYSSQHDGPANGTVAREISDNKIKGVVYDSKGNAIPGAIVIITGTTSGTVTDRNGNFILDGVAGDGSLTVASEGFRSRTIKVDNNTEFTIALIGEDEEILPPPPPPPSALENSEIKPPPPPAHIVPGSAAGKPTAPLSSVSVRNSLSDSPTGLGRTEIITGNSPLYIIDGIISENLEHTYIDPHSIESVSVLKGESAIKAYGDKGKDGVIIIKTKETAPDSSSASSIRFATGGIPLYIVDGIITTDISYLEASDIKSIHVLKGHTGSELYGEEGKDGVIIIETKKQ
jgi:hypothetical protein